MSVKHSLAGRRLFQAISHLIKSGNEIIREDGIGALLFKIKEYRSRSIGASDISLLEPRGIRGEGLTMTGMLMGKFQFPADMLDRFEVLTAHRDVKPTYLRLSISDENGTLIRQAIVRGKWIKDGDYTRFNFSPVKNSAGKTLVYKIEPCPGESVTVFLDATASTDPRSFTCDTRTIDGSICLKAYARLGRRRTYDVWIMKNEPGTDQLRQYKENTRQFAFQPKISIITPVYNPGLDWIRAAVESVINQAYPNWELCIADASTIEDVKQLLREYAAKDVRIKVKFPEQNLGISGNSNEALRMATGDYLGFLDHDDELSPDALYEVVRLLQADPDVDIIYTDEDFISPSGIRIFPSFKPEWSPDLFLSGMYACHFNVYNRALVDQVGLLRKEYDGAQDYDFALRCIEKARHIRHIPRVLYHWRQAPSSTSLSLGNKGYANTAAINALNDYLRRNGIKGETMPGIWAGSYRVRRDLVKQYSTSVIVYATNPSRARRCAESVLHKGHPFEILLIDGCSGTSLQDMLKASGLIDRVTIVPGHAISGLAAKYNAASKMARGDVLLFLAEDIKAMDDGWMNPLLEHVQREEVGAVGCKLVYPNGRVQHAGLILGMKSDGDIAMHIHRLYPAKQHGFCGRIDMIQDFTAVTSDCMMIRKDVYEKSGGFDQSLKGSFHDLDLCLRLRQAGYLIVYTPYAVLRRNIMPHHRIDCSDDLISQEDARTIAQRWSDTILKGDPYFSPALSTEYEDVRIRI